MNRTLHRAVVFSLVLHAAVLFGWSVERISARWEEPPAPLEARLVEPPPPPPRKEEAVKPPAPTAPPVRKAAPRPKPPAVAKPAPEPEPEPESEPEFAAEPQPAPALPAPPPVPPVVAKVEPRPMPQQPSAAQVEAVTREQYRLALIDAARRHNRYPPLARENNWEGEVLVRMEIAADGRVSLGIERSSGHPILDRQAMEMFKRAQAQVPVPSTLRGKTLSFELRAIYNLRDQVSG